MENALPLMMLELTDHLGGFCLFEQQCYLDSYLVIWMVVIKFQMLSQGGVALPAGI